MFESFLTLVPEDVAYIRPKLLTKTLFTRESKSVLHDYVLSMWMTSQSHSCRKSSNISESVQDSGILTIKH